MAERPDDDDLPRISTQLPWDRMPRESDEAWRAFVEYRDMGLGRSAQRVADILDRSLTNIHHHSARWQWRRRVGMYEQHLDAHRQSEHEKAVREMARRHVASASFMLHTSMKVLQRVDPADISVRDAIAMFRAAVPAERQGRAAEQAFLPTQSAATLGGEDDLDDDQLFGDVEAS